MPKPVIFFFMFIAMLVFGIFHGHYTHKKPVNLSFEGRVIFIDWQSPNHAMPLIEVKRDNGTVVKFTSNRITLTSEQLKVGDFFKKDSGSKSCLINKNLVPCIN